METIGSFQDGTAMNPQEPKGFVTEWLLRPDTPKSAKVTLTEILIAAFKEASKPKTLITEPLQVRNGVMGFGAEWFLWALGICRVSFGESICGYML